MLHEALANYLFSVESTVQRLKNIYVERYEEEILTNNRVNLRIRIRFSQGHLLELNAAVIIEAKKLIRLDYRYHFQGKQNDLIFRYDNTPHFPGLKNFPHHKHIPDKIIDTAEPSILKVIAEADFKATS